MAGYQRDHYLPKETSTVVSTGGVEMKVKLGTSMHFAVLSRCTATILQGAENTSTSYSSASTDGPMPVLIVRVATTSIVDGLPVIHAGAAILGDATIVLQKDQKFKDITIRLRGALLNPQTNKSFFLDMEHSLVPQWSGLVSVYKAGRHILPFRIPLPSHCNVAFQDSPLPPTFSSRGQPMSIRYDLIARIKKPGLWADEQASLQLLYVPRTRPVDSVPLPFLDFGFSRFSLQPASELLTWAETTKQFSASIDNQRTVIFDASFALANAPVYTRGVFVSYVLSLESWDAPALELVGSPQAVTVSVLRQVIVDTPGGFSGLGTSTGKPERVTDLIATGRHWLEPGDQFPKRILRGEVALRKELRPHFEFPLLSVIYCIVVQLRAEGFAQTNKAEEYLFVMPLGIATDLPEKVRQTA
ncbi:hypothetical protein CALCODRAFT_514728 [Calocera cornea HHB12733]|uniref:Arrestin-like N-terminal domain-containing protein n=1 Tax=Calocera cornea HHB12733 TaxID=1353952 RepID=A0A165J5U6_9BASI|nr:hypothetical protein CALCODRAFT_514728 [Calocera cornea HHB12733]